MLQQINFYSDEFRPKIVVFPLRRILQIIALTTLLLCVIIVVLEILLFQIESKKQLVISSKAEVEKKLAAMEQDKVAPAINLGLEEEVRKMKLEISEKARIVAYIKRDKIKAPRIIHSYFDELIRLDLPGLWLTSIDIFSRGAQINLKGISRSAESLPQYLQGLQGAGAFNGLSFKLLDLTKEQVGRNEIKFYLSSKNEFDASKTDLPSN